MLTAALPFRLGARLFPRGLELGKDLRHTFQNSFMIMITRSLAADGAAIVIERTTPS